MLHSLVLISSPSKGIFIFYHLYGKMTFLCVSVFACVCVRLSVIVYVCVVLHVYACMVVSVCRCLCVSVARACVVCVPSAVVLFMCKTPAIADIVILVDGSWSIGRINFRLVRSFLEKLVSAFSVEFDKTRIGGSALSPHAHQTHTKTRASDRPFT